MIQIEYLQQNRFSKLRFQNHTLTNKLIADHIDFFYLNSYVIDKKSVKVPFFKKNSRKFFKNKYAYDMCNRS